jgi:hypothetical protein
LRNLIEEPVLFDRDVVQGLADELDSPDTAVRFLGDYLCLLPQRLKRILTALDEMDTESALDALLSLKITSSMTGALRAEACCRTIHALVREENFVQAWVEAEEMTVTVSRLHAVAPTLLAWAKMDLEGPRPKATAPFDALGM